jgi:hypothetical protein
MEVTGHGIFKPRSILLVHYNDTTITRLLSYAVMDKDRDKGENDEIRKAAVAKIKSYEHWETDLIRILEGKEIGDIFNAYGFLAG